VRSPGCLLRRPPVLPMTASAPPDGARGLPAARLAVVEEHTVFADALEIAFADDGYDVVRPEVAKGRPPYDAFVAGLLHASPRVVVMDLDQDGGPAAQLVAPLASAGVHVVVLTASHDLAWWGECLHHGAATVVATTEPLSQLLASVRRTLQGRVTLTPGKRQHLLRLHVARDHLDHAGRERLARLTDREQAVLAHLMLGHHVVEIAQSRVVSESTVRSQVRSVLAKLEVSSQLAAVALAHQVGWRPPA